MKTMEMIGSLNNTNFKMQPMKTLKKKKVQNKMISENLCTSYKKEKELEVHIKLFRNCFDKMEIDFMANQPKLKTQITNE